MANDRDEKEEDAIRYEIVGKFLRKCRENAGRTQADVAAMLDYSTSQFVSNWERGKALPPAWSLPRIAEIYQIASNDLIEKMMEYQKAHLEIQRRRLHKLFS